MKSITVSEAIDRSISGDSACVTVEGILNFEFENVSLSHWPKAERVSGCQGIWIDEHDPVFAFDQAVLERWSGKRVVVLGMLERSQSSTMDGVAMGFGHFGLYDTRLRVRRIDLLKRWKKEHPEEQ